jgi:hypothetical protein
VKKSLKIFLIVIICCFFIGLEAVYHFKMNVLIKPLKQEFTQVIKNGYDKVTAYDHADGTTYLLSYNGRLDAILKKRDKFLKENGYIILGGWHARDYKYTDFSAIYLKVKF